MIRAAWLALLSGHIMFDLMWRPAWWVVLFAGIVYLISRETHRLEYQR